MSLLMKCLKEGILTGANGGSRRCFKLRRPPLERGPGPWTEARVWALVRNTKFFLGSALRCPDFLGSLPWGLIFGGVLLPFS